MKKFLITCGIFAMAFFLFDKLFLLVINYSPKTEVDKRLEMLVNGQINKDIIILGSSRGARNIIASEIEKETGSSAYNLSYPGSNIEFHEFLLQTLVKFNHPPKLVLLSVDPEALLPSKSLNFRLERLYPLVKYDYITQELVNRGEKSSFLLTKLFALYRINKTNFDLRKKKFSKLDTILSCGSMPISFQREGRAFVYGKDTSAYNSTNEQPNKVKAFNEICEICRQNKIKLCLVFPPDFNTYNPTFENRIKKLAGQNVLLIRYDASNPVYMDKSYYYDESHLSKQGAEIFTLEIARFLKSPAILN